MLFNTGDINELVDAMKYLIQRKDLIKQFGLQARATVETNYSSKTMTRHYCNLYDKLIKGMSV
jgi:glycosyltransferase involved in cell wall biosynthesis